jgi:hypothetical protein
VSQAKADWLRSRIQIDPDAPPSPAALQPVAPAESKPTEAAKSDPVRSALDDPAIVAGRNGYRSFYVDDTVFARFRAAIYWLSRREDALDQVSPNMSVAVEEFMRSTTESLEQQFNGGEVFRATPDQLKPSRRRGRPRN